jgi:glycosyltransferase involved in cell wall biosynthesis
MKTGKIDSVSIILPVYRNEGSIKLTFKMITDLFNKSLPDFTCEFIFVNDGSDDNSMNELMELHRDNKNVKIISFSRNFGQVHAIVAGLKYSTSDATIIMSADLQDPVELIEKMINEWKKGNEVIICNRETREDGITAKIVSNIFYFLIKISNPKMPVGGFDFILLDQQAVIELNKIEERNRFFQGDVLWLGFGVKFISYKRLKRTIGKSQWTFSKKLKYFLDGLLGTSYLLIRFISFTGILSSIIAFIYAILITYNRIVHEVPFKGWAPIMILILFMGGLIMIMLGIIGEYIWRIYDETRKRPTYIIKESHF